MIKIAVVALSILFVLNPIFAAEDSGGLGKGSIFVTYQMGLNTMAKAVDMYADPYDKNLFPMGGGFEIMLTDQIGIGGSFMYDKWHDIFGVYGGVWSCRLVKPSFDLTYHLRTQEIKAIDFLAGTQIGYSIIDLKNVSIPEAAYTGNLGNEFHFAPFIGINLHSPRNDRSFFERFSLTVKVVWSVAGDYSGSYGIAGPAFQIR
ncbi:MAG: hypothetical protein JXR49_10005 [Acidobacteria bacterium]|nr:hypothetical protein [Acidobacteriota bacterium]